MARGWCSRILAEWGFHGKAPWKRPLSEPCTVSAVHGNKVDICTTSGDVIKDVHVENVILVPEAARDLEEPGAALEILDDAETRGLPRRSLGQMAEAKEQEVLGEAELLAPVDLGTRDRKRLEKLSVGAVVAFASGVERRRCRLGLVLAVDRPAGEVQIRRYYPVSAGRLRVRWQAALKDETDPSREGPSLCWKWPQCSASC